MLTIMTTIKIYTLPICPNCKILKHALENEGVQYEEINMASAGAMSELYANDVYTATAPVLRIDKKFYINIKMPEGLKDILEYHGVETKSEMEKKDKMSN
jgi:glutaredoxin